MSANVISFRPHTDPAPVGPTPLPGSDTEASMPVSADSELFIRNAFATDPRVGSEAAVPAVFCSPMQPCNSICLRPAGAEDLVADLFYTFYTKELYKQVKGSYRAYLYQAVRNRPTTVYAGR